MSAQVEQQDTHRRRGLVWLGFALLVLGAGVGVVLQWQVAEAGAASTGSVSAAAAKKPAPAPTTPGNGQGNNGNGGGNGGGGSSTPAGKTLNVSGTVVGQVAPGVPATLNVTVQNPNSSDVDLTALTAAMTSVETQQPGTDERPACNKDWFVIGQLTATQRIARDGQLVVSLPITLLKSATVNQDNCKGVTYTFGFTATANQV
jgi:hypothetical protein